MTEQELNEWIIEKAWHYSKGNEINIINRLKTKIANMPNELEHYKVKLARELLFLFKTSMTEHGFVGREFLHILSACNMTLEEAQNILAHCDIENDTILNKQQLKSKLKKFIIRYKKYNATSMKSSFVKNMLDKIEAKGNSEFLKIFSLDIFDERETGIKYYKEMILKDIEFLLVRMTEEEMGKDIDDLILEIHRMRKAILENYALVPEMTDKVKQELDNLLENEELKRLKERFNEEQQASHDLEEEPQTTKQ